MAYKNTFRPTPPLGLTTAAATEGEEEEKEEEAECGHIDCLKNKWDRQESGDETSWYSALLAA